MIYWIAFYWLCSTCAAYLIDQHTVPPLFNILVSAVSGWLVIPTRILANLARTPVEPVQIHQHHDGDEIEI